MDEINEELKWQQRRELLKKQELEMAQLFYQKALEMLEQWDRSKTSQQKAEDLVDFVMNGKSKRRKKK